MVAGSSLSAAQTQKILQSIHLLSEDGIILYKICVMFELPKYITQNLLRLKCVVWKHMLLFHLVHQLMRGNCIL